METVFRGFQASTRGALKGLASLAPPASPDSCFSALPFLFHHQQPNERYVDARPPCARLSCDPSIPSVDMRLRKDEQLQSTVLRPSLPHVPSHDPVTQRSEARVSQNCSGSLYDSVAFGKEKLHLFHRDGKKGQGRGGQSPGGWGWLHCPVGDRRLRQVRPKRQMKLLLCKRRRAQSCLPPSSQKAASCSFETGRTESVIEQSRQGQRARLNVVLGHSEESIHSVPP